MKWINFILEYLTMVLIGQCLANQDTCSVQSLTSPGDVMFGVLSNIHVEGETPCSILQPGALAKVTAINWLFDKLNEKNYITGVKLGTVTYDVCGREDVADAMLARLLPEHTTGNCQPANISGILACTWSGQTAQISYHTRALSLPILAPTSTAASLSDRDRYPNVYRLVPTDTDQMKMLTLIAKRLGWMFVAVVYTDDTYGKEGAQQFSRFAKMAEICVGIKLSIQTNYRQISPHSQIPYEILEKLLKTVSTTKDQQLGVVYIGQKSVFGDLMLKASSMKDSAHDLQSLFWLVTDTIGLDKEVFRTTSSDLACNVISVTLSSPYITEFEDYFIGVVKSVIEGDTLHKGVTWYREYVETLLGCKLSDGSGEPHGSQQCSSYNEEIIRERIHENTHIYHTLAAAYTFAKAVYSLHTSLCKSTFEGICEEMQEAINEGKLNAAVHLINVQFYIAQTGQFPYLPDAMKEEKWQIQFNEEGGLVLDKNQPAYYIHDYKCAKESVHTGFHRVGEYFPRGEHLNLTANNVTFVIPNSEGGTVDSESVLIAETAYPILCVESCQMCGCNNASVRYVYRPGDFILVGLVPLHHHTGEVPFGCGRMRMEGSIQLQEAFFKAIDIFNDPKGPFRDHALNGKIGGLIIDTCYNSMRASNVISRFHSGDLILKNPVPGGETIDQSKVVGYVGALSSEVTQLLAEIIRPLNLMMVSFGSTAVSLLSKPNLLMTVPADDRQAQAMIEVVRRNGWEQVQIVYIDNAYGRSGFEELKKYAKQAMICITQVEKVGTYPNRRASIRAILNRFRPKSPDQTRIVILFLPQFESIEFLQVAKEGLGTKAFKQFLWIGTESWADRMNVLRETGMEALGSLTVKIATHPIQSFQEYFTTLSPWIDEGKRNPFLIEYWEKQFKCKLPNVYRPGNPNPDLCTPYNGHSLETNFQQEVLADKVIFATLGLAQGVNQVAQKLCPYEDKSASHCPHLRREDTLMQIKMATKSADMKPFLHQSYHPFQDRGDGNVNYIINNVQTDSQGNILYKEVGEFDCSSGLKLNIDDIKFYNYDQSPKNITCSDIPCILNEIEVKEDAWKKNLFVPGDILLGALLPLHPEWHEGQPLPEINPSAVLQVETLLWAIDQINRDKQILPKIKIGAHVLDTFDNPDIGSFQTVSLFGPGRYLHLNVSHVDVKSLMGFITGSQPDVALVLRKIISKHKRLQIEIAATLSGLDEHLAGNANLLRISHSVETEVRAIVKLLEHFQWNYVSIVFSDCTWGKDAFKLMKDILNKQGVCINLEIPIALKPNEQDALLVTEKLNEGLSHKEANVVIMLLKDHQTQGVIKTIGRRRIATLSRGEKTPEMIFIGGESFLGGLKHMHGLHVHAANRSIGILPIIPNIQHGVPELIQHLEQLKERPRRNPWFSHEAMSKALDHFKTGKDQSPIYVLNAVYTFAVGLHYTQRELCESPELCSNFQSQTDMGLQLTYYAREAYHAMKELYPKYALTNTPDMEIHFFTVDPTPLEQPDLKKVGVFRNTGELNVEETLTVALADVTGNCGSPGKPFIKTWKLPVLVVSIAVGFFAVIIIITYGTYKYRKVENSQNPYSETEAPSLPGRPSMGTFRPSGLLNGGSRVNPDAPDEGDPPTTTNTYQNDSLVMEADRALSETDISNVEFDN